MMTSTRRLPAAAALAGVIVLAGCGSGVTTPERESSEATAAPAAVQSCGAEVRLRTPPQAAVGLYPAQTEMLLRLGLADRMVGQAQVAASELPEDLRAQAAEVAVLSEDTPPNREELLAIEPDFVFSPTSYEFSAEQGFASLEQLDEAGVSAYIAAGGCPDRRMTGTVDDLFVDLEALGEIFGVQEEAATLAADARTDLDEVETGVADVDRLSVAQVFVEGTSISAIGAGVEYDMISRAGGDPIFAPDDPAFADFFAAQISPEELAAAEPDALVFAVTGPDNEQQIRDYLTSTFPDLPAVREDRLIAIDNADTMPGTLGNVTVVRTIASALYPEQVTAPHDTEEGAASSR